jgi:hypothetical protein
MENPVEDGGGRQMAGVAGEVLISVTGPPSSEDDQQRQNAHTTTSAALPSSPASSSAAGAASSSSWAGLGSFSTALVGVGDGNSLVLPVLPDSDIEYLNVAANLKVLLPPQPPSTLLLIQLFY